MAAKLYAVPASHPCAAVERALELKGIEYRRVDLVPVFHKLHQKLRFRDAATVPGVVFDDGRRVIGSRAILRALEEMRPEPALFGAPGGQATEADEWGEEVLQPLSRRVVWMALSAAPGAVTSYSEGARLVPPVPGPLARLSARPVTWAERRINASTVPAVRADLAALPRHLDRVDAWLADATLGAGETPSAADLQVASGLRLLTTIEDLDPLFAGRPSRDYARRVFPRYPGRTPAGALKAEWLPGPVSREAPAGR